MKHNLNQRLSNKRDCNGNHTDRDGQEIKSGPLCLIQKNGKTIRKISMFVRVYKTGLDHYAVLYRDQAYSRNTGYVSLKNCSIEKSKDKNERFQVTLNDCEGVGICFEAKSCSEACDWIDALRPQVRSAPSTKVLAPTVSRSPLPTLIEIGEEE